MRWYKRWWLGALLIIGFIVQFTRNFYAYNNFNLSCNNGRDSSHHLVLMESLESKTGMFMPGTDHWFHFLENIVTNLPYTISTIWPQGNLKNILYIIFREEISAAKLSSFCCLMLAALMSGGRFTTIRIGYATVSKEIDDVWSATGLKSADNSLPLGILFHELHVLERPLSHDGDLSHRYIKHPKPAVNHVCFNRDRIHPGYYRLVHITYSDTYEWFSGNGTMNSQYYLPFRKAVRTMCSARMVKRMSNETDDDGARISTPHSSTSRNLSSNNTVSDHSLNYIYVRQKYSSQPIYPLRRISPPRRRRRVVIYQRDRSRTLLNADEVQRSLTTLLNAGQASTPWSVDILMHSNARDACELIRTMSQATVFVTPHGFQSMLLLFQPLDSLLVEVHPSHYLQPGFYGEMTASLRNNLRLSRPYLYGESGVDSAVCLGLVGFFNKYLDKRLCSSSSSFRGLCRYMYRLQSVHMPSSLVTRTADVVHRFFPVG